MKYIVSILITVALLISSFSFVGTASAASRTRGYFKKSGTYVMPHYKSTRDSFKWNNYSSKGNYNPFTGKKGYKSW